MEERRRAAVRRRLASTNRRESFRVGIFSHFSPLFPKARPLPLPGSFTTPLSDGWGLTNGADGSGSLVASDGSDSLHTLDATTLALRSSVRVSDGGTPVRMLNELEMIDDEIWANVWLTECVARIDPATGRVNGWVLFHGLRDALPTGGAPAPEALNGIAWDARRRRLFVTGKYWSRVFQVRLTKMPHNAGELAKARQACNAPRMG